MQGVILFFEILVQYFVLMVMEEIYGQECIYKFLKYEVDSYLWGCGWEIEWEKFFFEVYVNQGYIYYWKGSVVMYCFKEMIGEDWVNVVLCSVIDFFVY